MSADLHCHTILSDGTVSIEELVLLAKGKGLDYVSITDHDTYAGAVRAKISGQKYGIEVIEGAEISAFDKQRGRKVHILAYLCDHPNRLAGMFKKISDSRKKAMTIAIQKVLRLYPIPVEMILKRAQGGSNIFKQHVMKALIDAGYTDSVYGDIYKKLFHSKTGFARTNIEYPDVFAVVDAVHEAGGVAVLAHPDAYDSYDILEELAEYGLDGFEMVCPRANPERESMLEDFAAKYGLIMTGGSDFHGSFSNKPVTVGSCSVDNKIVEKLRDRQLKYKIEEV